MYSPLVYRHFGRNQIWRLEASFPAEYGVSGFMVLATLRLSSLSLFVHEVINSMDCVRLSEIPVSLQKFGSVTVSFELKTPVCGDCSVSTLLHCLMLPNLSCHLPPLNYLPSYILEAAGISCGVG
ncbi:hypothetical protein J3E68DRAFT_407228 [Trichoderma sp. SZMC 28012]